MESSSIVETVKSLATVADVVEATPKIRTATAKLIKMQVKVPISGTSKEIL
jgi:hypothetical protein